MTNIPFDPPTPPADDGRIYPPQADYKKSVKGRSDLPRYATRRHLVTIRDNGAITITGRGIVEIKKVGSNGQGT